MPFAASKSMRMTMSCRTLTLLNDTPDSLGLGCLYRGSGQHCLDRVLEVSIGDCLTVLTKLIKPVVNGSGIPALHIGRQQKRLRRDGRLQRGYGRHLAIDIPGERQPIFLRECRNLLLIKISRKDSNKIHLVLEHLVQGLYRWNVFLT